MGYRIAYRSMKKKPGCRRGSSRLPILVLLCFSLFLLLVEMMWHDGAAYLQSAVTLPGKALAVSALNGLADELHNGESLVTAFADFCRKLLV